MKRNTAINRRSVISAAIALLFLSGEYHSASAATINAGGNGTWTGATDNAPWTPAASAPDNSGFNDYVVGGGFKVSTPTAAASFGTVNGTVPNIDTLTINTTGTLALAGTGGNRSYTFGRLVVDGGTVLYDSAENRTHTIANGTGGDGVVVGSGGMTIDLNGGTARGITITAPISGTGDIARVGNSSTADHVLSFSGNNSSYSGNITTNQGILSVDSINALGDTVGKTTLVRYAGSSYATQLRLNVSGGTLLSPTVFSEPVHFNTTNSSVLLTAAQNNITYSGLVTVEPGAAVGGPRFEVGSGITGFKVTSDVDVSGITATMSVRGGNASSTAEFLGKITTNVAGAVSKTNASTWTLSNPNNTIHKFVAQQGTVKLGATNALGNQGDGPNLLMGQASSGGIVDLDGKSQKVSGLGLDIANSSHTNVAAHTANIIRNTLTGSANTSTVSIRASADQFFPGVISGNTNLVVNMVNPATRMIFEPDDGAGPNAYGASNLSYTGTTRVQNGVMMALGAMATNGASNVSIDALDDTLTGNPILVRARASGASYAGYGSQSTSVANGGAVGTIGTTAEILAGTNSSGVDQSIAMRWRQRSANEQVVTFNNYLVSDVLDLGGMVNANGGDLNNPGVFPSGQTDIFVLQMSYDPTLFDEASSIANQTLALSWLDVNDLTNGAGGSWKNAVLGNFGGTNTYAGDVAWSEVGALNDLSDDLGRWGVNSSTNTVWAVVNHNSSFAVVPEPSTFVMGAAIAVGLATFRRRRIS